MSIRRYPFGFMFSDEPSQTFSPDDADFDRAYVWDNYHLYTRSETQPKQLGDHNMGLIWLGYAVDTSQEAPASHVSETAYSKLSEGLHAFHEFLDYVVGRWAAIISINGEVSIYHDALALQPVYLSKDAVLAASHLPLISRELDSRRNESTSLSSLGQLKLPFETEDKRVLALAPNFAFSFHSLRPERYYPRDSTDIRHSTLSESLNEARILTQRSMAYWSSLPFELHSALTAGLDSRVNVAAALGTGCDITAVSYGSNRQSTEDDGATARSYKLDVQTAAQICRDLSIPQFVLPIEKSKDFRLNAAEKDILSKNSVGSHASSFQGLYEEFLGKSPSICFVGTGYEAVKDYYVSPNDPLDDFQEFKKTFTALTNPKSESRSPEESEQVAAKYWKEYGYQQASTNGISPGNLVFWEVRAGRFQSEAINCQTTAFLPIAPLAIRRLFKLGLGLPFESRRTSTFFKSLIAELCPPLAGYPINGKPFMQIESPFVQLPGIYSKIAAEDKVEKRRQTISNKIQLPNTHLADGDEVFYQDSFQVPSGTLRLTYHNKYNVGKAINAVSHFVRINDVDVYICPIGERSDPNTVLIDGLSAGDTIEFGLRSTRANGVAWTPVSRTQLTEWQQIEQSAADEVRVSSTRSFMSPSV